MFKKEKITHHVDPKALIYKVPRSDFKKGQILEIPQGYEASLFEADGTQELIQDVYKHRLERPVQYIYLSKSNRAAVQSKWGTPNRIKVTTDQGPMSLGAFGHIEFQLLNPIRFIEKRTDREGHIDGALITQMVLMRIGEAFQDIIPSLEPLSKNDEIKTIQALKDPLKKALELKVSIFGLSITSLVIDSMNFQPLEEV